MMDDEIFGVQLLIKNTGEEPWMENYQEPVTQVNQSTVDYSEIRQELENTQMNIHVIQNAKQCNEETLVAIEAKIKHIINKIDKKEKQTLETPINYDPELTDIVKTQE